MALMTFKEVEKAAESLSTSELFDLSRRLADMANDRWDKQMEEDVATGRFDKLIEEAKREYRQGKTKSL